MSLCLTRKSVDDQSSGYTPALRQLGPLATLRYSFINGFKFSEIASTAVLQVPTLAGINADHMKVHAQHVESLTRGDSAGGNFSRKTLAWL
jgi:hypothetical protein